MSTIDLLDSWLLFLNEDDDEEPHAEANTFHTPHGYRVEWSLTDVGQVSARTFATYHEAWSWLTDAGYVNYTA